MADLHERMAKWNTSLQTPGNESFQSPGSSTAGAKRKISAPDDRFSLSFSPHLLQQPTGNSWCIQAAAQFELVDTPSAAKRSRSDDFELLQRMRHAMTPPEPHRERHRAAEAQCQSPVLPPAARVALGY